MAKAYVDNNDYIDVDLYGMSKNNATVGSRSSTNPDDLAKARAAVYRFYSHVTIDNGKLTCDLKNGADINISQDTYMTLLENLNDMNRSIEEARQRGDSIVIPPVDQEYLDSLLK